MAALCGRPDGATSKQQSQMAVAAYFSSKQLLPFGFAEQSQLPRHPVIRKWTWAIHVQDDPHLLHLIGQLAPRYLGQPVQ